MKKKILLFALALATGGFASAQWNVGNTIPNVVDDDPRNGQTVDLYGDFLDKGMALFIDASAVWCGPCVQFHQTRAMENMWNSYGPDGTGELGVVWVDAEGLNSLSSLQGSNSQGYDWTQHAPHPMISTNAIPVDAYPTMYMVCPDGVVKRRQNWWPTAEEAVAYARANCELGGFKAGFEASDVVVTEGGTVTFTDKSFPTDGSITSWNWTFEGGTPSSYSGQNPPAITYNTVGEYDVTLQISNGTDTDSKTESGFIAVTDVVLPGGYCPATHAEEAKNEMIVKLAANGVSKSIDNPSDWATYNNFSHLVVDMDKGGSYTVDVTVNNGWSSGSQLGIWVDWNGDGDFEDANEEAFKEVLSTDPGGEHSYNATISVPSDAKMGYTKMRTRLFYIDGGNYPGPFSPCGDQDPGEVEDYTVQILGTDNIAETAQVQMSLYPNPVENELVVSHTLNKTISVEVTDLNGKLLMAEQIQDRMDVQALPAGVYLIRVLDTGNVMKFVKN